MTAKDRAIQLYEKFRPLARSGSEGLVGWHTNTKEIAIKCVDEILEALSLVGSKKWIFHGDVKLYYDIKSELEKM